MASIEKISIALSSDMLRMVRQTVAGGDYASTSEVVREALREWKARRVSSQPARQQVNAGRGLASAYQHEIAQLCRRYVVRSLALFGSATRDDFDAVASDIDLAVVFHHAPNAATAKDYFALKQELERLFGRPVDLVETEVMPDSRLKRIIERTQVPLYAEPEAA